MENNKTGKGIEYHPFKTEDKHYFGGFFNLTDNNLHDVFKEFKERISDKGNEKDIFKIIDKHFIIDMSIVDYERNVKILNEYFPVIDFLDNKLETNLNKRITYFKENFFALLKALNELRNFYTHYYHEPILFDNYKQTLFDFINDTLFKTIIEVKKNYLKEDKTKEILKDSLKDEIERLSKIKINELVEKKRKDPKFKYSDDPKQIKNSLYNDAFKDMLYENKKEKINITLNDRTKATINQYDIHKNRDFDIPLSTSGLVFLLSMFLSKQEIEDFKSNIKGYKGKVVKNDDRHNSLKYMATHKVYSVLAYKGLKYRVKTDEFSKETLLMQMIDELSKVPKCVYENLDETKKKDFIEDWNEYYKDNEENDDNLYNSFVAHPVIRKRYEDKFNYFAIRFLDEFANFPTLKFQVYAGIYLHDSRIKTIEETKIITDRNVKEKINIFGKLSNFDNLKKDFFSKLSEQESTNWEFFPNPSYNFLKQEDSSLSNNIAIYLELKDKRIIEEKNKIIKQNHLDEKRKKRNTNKPTKKEIINEILKDNNNFIQGEPTAILSLNELPALLHKFFSLKEKKGEQIEEIIRNKIEKQFKDIKNPNEENRGIPKSLFNKSDGRVNYNKLVKDIRNEINITNEKISIFNKNKNDAKNYEQLLKNNRFRSKKERPVLRKYVFYNSEKGTEAIWIANDIKRFMPDKFKENWKGYQHSELQRMLAFYDDFTKKEILKLIGSCEFDNNLFNIKSCFYKNTFEDFYFDYLKKRLEMLNNVSNQLQTFENENNALKSIYKQCFIFLKKQNYIENHQDKIKNRILAKPAFLPKGIFDEKPTMIIGKNPMINKDDFAKWFVDFLENKDYQTFYDKQLYHFNTDFKKEAIIKKQKIKDFYSLQIVNYLMQIIFKKEEKLKLSELFQTRQKRLELNEIAKQQANKTIGDSSTNIRNQTYIWNKDVALSFFDNKVKVDEVKLKNIGKYIKIERDIRVKTFLSYEENIDWMIFLPHNWNKDGQTQKPINVIDIQIQEYEQIRSEKILKEIQNLEKYIYEKTNDKSELLFKGFPNFRNYILNGLLKNIKKIDIKLFKLLSVDISFETIDLSQIKECTSLEQKAIILIAIRNKFAHNQLPNKEVYDFCQSILKKDDNQTYAKYYLEVFKKLKQEILMV